MAAPYRVCLHDASDNLLVSYGGLPTKVCCQAHGRHLTLRTQMYSHSCPSCCATPIALSGTCLL
jgi:hypothetical protein